MPCSLRGQLTWRRARWTRGTFHHQVFTHSSCRHSHALAKPVVVSRRGVTDPYTPLHVPRPKFFGAESTIYALSSGAGRAAVAVIRISGPACIEIYRALCPGKSVPKPRYAAYRSLHDPSSASQSNMILDPGVLVLYFAAPRSATGEDVLEYHVHGGPAIVKATLNAISRCNQVDRPIRYAEPGEFIRRAFLNDRIDLTQVEALGDTLSAFTEEQRRLSVRGTVSRLGQLYESWRRLLLLARGELEALIDFSEDQHFDETPAALAASVAVQVKDLVRTISVHIANAVRGDLLRSGIKLALIGAPNVGKSSLLNQIVGRNAAIVSKQAGTTRDVVEVGIDLGGFYCRLGDTAGLRESDASDAVGEIEEEGIKRAREQAAQSDVVILVFSIEEVGGQSPQVKLDPSVVGTATQLLLEGKEIVVAINKVDNWAGMGMNPLHAAAPIRVALPGVNSDSIFFVSCLDAEGDVIRPYATTASASTVPPACSRSIPPADQQNYLRHAGNIGSLLEGLTRKFKAMTAAESPVGEEGDRSLWEESLGATQRQRVLLEDCSAHLQKFLHQMSLASSRYHSGEGRKIELAAPDIDIVVAAESLRVAADCLAKITGKSKAGDVDEVLSVVFEKFCIGK